MNWYQYFSLFIFLAYFYAYILHLKCVLAQFNFISLKKLKTIETALVYYVLFYMCYFTFRWFLQTLAMPHDFVRSCLPFCKVSQKHYIVISVSADCLSLSIAMMFAGTTGTLFRYCTYIQHWGVNGQHIEAETKWPPFRSRHFQMHFLEWKC